MEHDGNSIRKAQNSTADSHCIKYTVYNSVPQRYNAIQTFIRNSTYHCQVQSLYYISLTSTFLKYIITSNKIFRFVVKFKKTGLTCLLKGATIFEKPHNTETCHE